MTFIDANKTIKIVPLESSINNDLEKTDPSLFKRLTYAKEVLIKMINKPLKASYQITTKEDNANTDIKLVVDDLMIKLPSGGVNSQN